MQIKTTRKLFRGEYQYKIVLVSSRSDAFHPRFVGAFADVWIRNFPKDTSAYSYKLACILDKHEDLVTRVQGAWVTVYTNDKGLINKIIKIDKSRVKYVCEPDPNISINSNEIISTVPFEFKVTLGMTTKNHDGFLEWATASEKVKLTKSCARDLRRPRSWGGTYFYITGEKNLLMARMHLGEAINKVERIINPTSSAKSDK